MNKQLSKLLQCLTKINSGRSIEVGEVTEPDGSIS